MIRWFVGINYLIILLKTVLRKPHVYNLSALYRLENHAIPLQVPEVFYVIYPEVIADINI